MPENVVITAIRAVAEEMKARQLRPRVAIDVFDRASSVLALIPHYEGLCNEDALRQLAAQRLRPDGPVASGMAFLAGMDAYKILTDIQDRADLEQAKRRHFSWWVRYYARTKLAYDGKGGIRLGRWKIAASRWPWQNGCGWRGIRQTALLNPADKNGWAARFGAGWRYKLGIEWGETTVMVNLLYGMLRINRLTKLQLAQLKAGI